METKTRKMRILKPLVLLACLLSAIGLATAFGQEQKELDENNGRTNLFVDAKRPGLLLLLLLAAFLVANPVLAGPTATLTGRVTDQSGMVIAGVKVEATNVETNVTFSGETNMEGLYSIPNLPPGTYRVIVQKFAFRTIVKPDVELHVQEVISLNFSMEIGSMVESVTVEAGAPLLQDSPQRGGNFLSREVRDLPLVSLNPISLARTLPGAIEPAGTTLYGRGPESSFSVNGQRFRANNYLLDSTENNDIAFTGIAQPFNIADAVEEVSVQTGRHGCCSTQRGMDRWARDEGSYW